MLSSQINIGQFLPLLQVICLALVTAEDYRLSQDEIDVVGTRLDNNVAEFLGITYAFASTRFEMSEPVLLISRENRRLKTRGKSCWQKRNQRFNNTDFEGDQNWNPNTEMNENCLTLNIWAPLPLPTDSSRPVIVWIHGGMFISGTATLPIYDGRKFAEISQAVVLTLNYRLGPYGFLYFGNEQAPGNVGLFDQFMALKWIRQYIQYFGGNKDLVTLIGRDAGAASIHMHFGSPFSTIIPHFKRAILHSGSAFSPWALHSQEEMLKRSIDFAKRMNCFKKDASSEYSATIACLRQARNEDLIANMLNVKNDGFMDFVWTPVNGTNFLPNDFDTKCPANAQQKDLIIVSNDNEAMYFALHYDPQLRHWPTCCETDNEMKAATQKFGKFFDVLKLNGRPELKNLVLDAYGLRKKTAGESHGFLNRLNRLFYERNYHAGETLFRRAFATCSTKPVGGEYFQFRKRNNLYNFPEWVNSTHGTDTIFLFHSHLSLLAKGDATLQAKYERESRALIQFYAEFAKTGNFDSNNPYYYHDLPLERSAFPSMSAATWIPNFIQNMAVTTTKACEELRRRELERSFSEEEKISVINGILTTDCTSIKPPFPRTLCSRLGTYPSSEICPGATREVVNDFIWSQYHVSPIFCNGHRKIKWTATVYQ